MGTRDPHLADADAVRRLEQERATANVYVGETPCPRVRAGQRLTLVEHPVGDYQDAIKRFGIDVVPRPPLKARFRFQDETGGYPEPRIEDPNTGRLATPDHQRIQQLRNWHWFYRFVMLGRHVHNLRLVQWQSAVDRLRRIRARKAHPPEQPTHPVSEVFTSELAVAYLYRWDVNRPSDISLGSKDRLDEIVAEAKKRKPRLGWQGDPASWGQAEEDALLEAIEAIVEAGKSGKLVEVAKMVVPLKKFPEPKPHWSMQGTPVGSLSRSRGSFRMVP